jgi:drug/metabolite transporter (DMT)-like permease
VFTTDNAMIVQTIQLALTPVFVLVAIGNILNILSTRLGRVVDRARYLQERHNQTDGAEHDMVVLEIRLVDKRISIITNAIRFMVLSGLCIGTTVAVLFLQGLAGLDMHGAAAIIFLASIVLLLVALLLFLRETQVAKEALSIPRDYLELHRKI